MDAITEQQRPISYGIVQTGPNVMNGIPCLRVLDINDGKINRSDLITTSKQISDAYKRTVLKEGDLVMPLRGKVGDVGIIDRGLEGANLTRGVALIAVQSAWSAPFFRQLISWSATRRRLEQTMNGSALQEIPIASLRSFKVGMPPSLSEQRAIATVLSDVDALLDALERFIAKKRDFKQATMQQLLTSQTRLPGFHGEWEVKRLGDILTVRHGKSQHEIIASDGRYPILASGGEIGRTNNFIYDKPSVLIGRKGTIDSPQYVDSPFWTVDTLFFTEIADEADAKFVFYKFTMIRWRSYNEASGVPSLNAKTIENIEIPIPRLPEQTAIATVLSDMDAELAALEQRLAKTRALKQGMMQELLTGRTRLV
nr:restriction endonuclease subunit S [Pseudomonas sp. 21LCFQ02]